MDNETMMTFEDVCAEIRALLKDIPPERWVWTRKDGDHATLAAWLGEYLSFSESQELHGVALDDDGLRSSVPGSARAVCFTGNGPSSEKHARLLMLVRAVLPELLMRATWVRPIKGIASEGDAAVEPREGESDEG